jgi:hypothetical protein
MSAFYIIYAVGLYQGDRVTGYNTTLKKYFFWKNYVTSFLLTKKDLRPKHQNSSTDFFFKRKQKFTFYLVNLLVNSLHKYFNY